LIYIFPFFYVIDENGEFVIFQFFVKQHLVMVIIRSEFFQIEIDGIIVFYRRIEIVFSLWWVRQCQYQVILEFFLYHSVKGIKEIRVCIVKITGLYNDYFFVIIQ